jgi:hypothetical protein
VARGGIPFARADDGRFAVGLPGDVRDDLRDLCEELRTLLLGEDASSDAGIARLFPAAYEDPLRNLDYEREAGGRLLASRLAGLDTVQATLGADAITEDELLAWLRTVNDLRLVLGARLDVTEESTLADVAADEEATVTFDLYHVLGQVESFMIKALDPGLEEDPSWMDPPPGG